jgi:hypothetical protein
VADYTVDTTKTCDTSDSIKNSDPIDTGTFCYGSEWIAYKDEKCFKLIRKWATHKEAEDICKKERLRTELYTPRLVSIKSATEQEYLTNFVFDKSGVKINVWIGARRLPENGNEFVWNDGSVIDFTNWVEGSPTEEIGRGCVEMQSRFTRKFSNISDFNLRGINGKWRDGTCESGNYVICQKLQAWSFPKLQQTFLDARKELRDTRNQLNDTRKELYNSNILLIDTRNQLEKIVYSTDCSYSKEWISCKIFTDIRNNNRQVIAIPRNKYDKSDTWKNSIEICKKYNASLVTIESIEKQFFLQTFGQLGGNFWTSGHKDLNGNWKWVNGNEVSYTKWDEHQPDNLGGNQNCIQVWNAYPEGNWKWDDMNCNHINFVVCEFSLNI